MKFLLVGTGFTPGASALIAKGLRQGAPVTLLAEPDNPYDANAVRVWVEWRDVSRSEELDEALAKFGLSVETMTWPMPLGHLGATPGTKAAKAAERGGHRFELVAKWHGLAAEGRGVGRLTQHPDGVVTVEVSDVTEGGASI